MKRLVPIILILLIVGAVAAYFFNQYWIHRYDGLIARQAGIYRLDPDLVWSVIYEETYFRSWKVGSDGEIGLMQVTPTVGREWAAETGMRDLERQMARDPAAVLHDPERNIQIGCWYLEKLYEEYRDTPGAEARMIAGYNAGPSRAADWNHVANGARPLTAEEFIARIDIPSTRAYVTSILERYRKLKENKKQKAEGGRQKAENVSQVQSLKFPSLPIAIGDWMRPLLLGARASLPAMSARARTNQLEFIHLTRSEIVLACWRTLAGRDARAPRPHATANRSLSRHLPPSVFCLLSFQGASR